MNHVTHVGLALFLLAGQYSLQAQEPPPALVGAQATYEKVILELLESTDPHAVAHAAQAVRLYRLQSLEPQVLEALEREVRKPEPSPVIVETALDTLAEGSVRVHASLLPQVAAHVTRHGAIVLLASRSLKSSYHFRKAWEELPKNRESWLAMGTLLAQMGDKKAIETLARHYQVRFEVVVADPNEGYFGGRGFAGKDRNQPSRTELQKSIYQFDTTPLELGDKWKGASELELERNGITLYLAWRYVPRTQATRDLDIASSLTAKLVPIFEALLPEVRLPAPVTKEWFTFENAEEYLQEVRGHLGKLKVRKARFLAALDRRGYAAGLESLPPTLVDVSDLRSNPTPKLPPIPETWK